MKVEKSKKMPRVIYSLIHAVALSSKNKLSLIIQQAKWRTLHPQSKMKATSLFPLNCISVGSFSYGDLNVVAFNRNTKLMIGNCVSVAQNVVFILDAEHSTNSISTFPYRTKIAHSVSQEAFSKGDIIVDDDVWIGYGATILSGVHIGQGAVIAAGALVSSNVEPYSIVGGVPAKIIKKRFNEEKIEYCKTLNYSMLTKELIQLHLDELYCSIEDMTINELRSKFSWFPKVGDRHDE